MNADMQVRKILVTCDGSPSSFGALEDLKHAGFPEECEAVAFSVCEETLPMPRSFGMVETAADERTSHRLRGPKTWARSAHEILRHNFPGWKISEEVRMGSVAREILTFADEWKPDVIVAGSHGRSGLGRFFFGSVSQKLVTEAQRSVRVGRKNARSPNQPLRILVGVDGSSADPVAVRMAVSRHWPAETEVKLFTAIGIFHYYGADMIGAVGSNAPEVINELRNADLAAARTVHERLLNDLAGRPPLVTSHVCEGDPKQALLSEAELWQADCIFVGSRDLGAVNRFLLGSVSSAVVARAHCSVEVVRAAAV
jgi:nucleotide-binding universal stress UspA family protein